MKNIKLLIEYDGKGYNGWQKQPNRPNIQGEIEKAIFKLTGEEVILTSSGRTDAGVCAYNQVANFKTDTDVEVSRIPKALNSYLKKDIVIKHAEEVDDKFHSRYNCKSKKYMYVINNAKYPSAINRDKEYHVCQDLDINAMKMAIKVFEGTHDFKAFRSSGTSSKDSVRTIYEANLEYINEKIYITLLGNGFMYNMVRIIAGTLLEVGLGRINANDVEGIIAGQDRFKAGRTLPPHGLFLMEVNY